MVVAQGNGGRIVNDGFSLDRTRRLEKERSRSRRSPGKCPGPTIGRTSMPASFARTDGRERERAGLDRKRYGETGTRGSKLHVQEKWRITSRIGRSLQSICGKNSGVKEGSWANHGFGKLAPGANFRPASV